MRLIKIGHDLGCGIVLQSNKVSGLHAEITVLNNGDILLEDKGSRNGTFVQGHQVNPGASVSIRRGDRITFGDTDLDWSRIPQPENLSNYRAIYGIGTNFRNEIKIIGNAVSRFHATLKIARDGKVYLEDHSRNGTTVDGVSIPSNKNVRVKRGSVVCVAGQEIDIKPYIPHSVWPRIISYAACLAAIVAIVLVGAWSGLFGGKKINDHPERAVACVVASFHYTVTFDDDPFVGIIEGWPKEWSVGYNPETQSWGLLGTNGCTSLKYTGTAFFVDDYGRMITNRHIACPWDYREEETTEAINQFITMWKNKLLPLQQMDMETLMVWARNKEFFERRMPLLNAVVSKSISLSQLNAYLQRFATSRIKISGANDDVRVGVAFRKYTNYSEFEHCTVIGDSQSDEIDVAMIQLNTGETPAKIKPYVIDMKNALADSQDLKTGSRNPYTFIGYPGGLGFNLEKLNGLNPMVYSGPISKRPDRYTIELQSMTWGGASGSPILDEKGRLAGVIAETANGTTMTRGVLAKYAVELYSKLVVEDPAEY